MVNQERANNGLAALTWDSSMTSYSDRRAKEITTDLSHNSAGGEMNVGENIAKGAISPDMVMDGWMRSDGHRANILNANYTKISVSCYYDGSTYYWVHISPEKTWRLFEQLVIQWANRLSVAPFYKLVIPYLY